ncbi:expression library immunization antigen 1 [Hirsutella rhossiliensis]|uniref:Expression library immunization antigen 1 n=1 Tax=Hirsutella rhossiliensis TaxID=111463 RepID=A0A9P8N7M5_9HYPO|nr:expression library immunization antigen 1 [Hirsutella rhossiliensis]KAH0966117.1 expression library immunization antigen 1 [Hirsutella rhossiliensis]
MVKSLVALAALCFGLSAAHFQMLYPESIGFEDDNEDKAPCGGFTPDFGSNKVVDFHVDGEALAMRLLHQQSNWLFRATTDQKADSGWQQMFPVVMQSGLGDFCEPRVTAPSDFVGKKGVVSVVSSAVDGLLYQCVAVNFVKGSAGPPSACKNTSSVKASFTNDAKLSALLGSAAGSSSSTPTQSSASGATSSGAASALKAWSAAGPGWSGAAAALLAGAVLGGVLLV